MYNAEQKSRFIKEYTDKISYRESAVRLFNRFEPYEEAWGADLCTVDADRIYPVIRAVVGLRSASSKMPLAVIRGYAQWCLRHGIPGATDTILGFSDSGTDAMRTQTVKNPRHLQRWLDTLFVPEENETADNTMRAFCWLAYSGLKAEQAIALKNADVDFENMRIHYDGHDYILYREAVPSLRNCVELIAFRYEHPGYGHSIYRDRVPGDDLFRSMRGVLKTQGTLVSLSRACKNAVESGKTDLRLSYDRIRVSGIFYRMYEDELAGFPVDFLSVPELGITDRQYDLSSSTNTQSAKHRALAAQYRKDYERWKQTLL